MVHVATVHWKSDEWIDIQLAYLKRFIRDDFRVYAFLNHIDRRHFDKFYYASDEPIEKHAVKLNLLADLITREADSDDLLVFLDGDAFPVGDVLDFATDRLKAHPLLAVQRLENNGDIQPHPCFCITTVGYWNAIRGDWKAGHTWTNRAGETVTDVGGNLLGILEREQADWYPITRSNKHDLHPIWFGVYGDVVYHHGAGFRAEPVSRLEYSQRDALERQTLRYRLVRLLPRKSIFRKLHRRVDRAVVNQMVDRNVDASGRMIDTIKADPDFFTQLI